MTEFWYDTRVGEMLVGEAALEERLPSSGVGDIRPLVELIQADTATIQELGIPSSPSEEFLDWSRDRFVEYGKWALHLLSSQAGINIVYLLHLRKLCWLGLGPQFESNFSDTFNNSILNFQLAIGAEIKRNSSRYSHWTDSDYISYGRDLAAKIKFAEGKLRRPTRQDLNAEFGRNNGPSEALIRRRFGSLASYTELLGFPDVRHWSREDYIAWGVEAVRANPETSMHTILRTLTSVDLGPSDKPIYKYFDGISNFHKLVIRTIYQQNLEKANTPQAKIKLSEYSRMLSNGDLPATAGTLPSWELLRVGGCRRVVESCLPHIDTQRKHRLATSPPARFCRRISKIKPTLKEEDIRSLAKKLDVHDDIWPPINNDLKIDQYL